MSEPSDDLVRERRGAISIVRINRPEARNAMNGAVIVGLGEAVIEAEADPGVRAIVLTGTGDRAFCAGMDLRAFAEGDIMGGFGDDEATAAFGRFLKGDVAVPMVAAANGSAVAGGFEALMSCDVVVAAEGARFGVPEVKRGLFAAGGGMWLGTRIPLAIALELALTGDPIEAERAVALGLVNAVVPAEEVLPRAVEIAERIAANGPLALAATKELMRLAVTDPAAMPARMAEWQATVFASDDAKEGATAFVEKRPPVWQGT